jgi:hypothetical protein
MREFTFSGGTLTQSLTFVTDGFSSEIENITVKEVKQADGSVLSQLPTTADADYTALISNFLRQETSLFAMKEFAKPRGLVLTRLDQDSSEDVTSILLSALDVNTILHQSGNTIRYTFNGTPDLSGVDATNDMLISESNGTASNDGIFVITAVSDGSDYIEVTNPDRADNTDDEATDAVGTCDVLSA